MHTYRAYPLNSSGRIIGPPESFPCEDDNEAIERAGAIMHPWRGDIELWQAQRLVISLPFKDA